MLPKTGLSADHISARLRELIDSVFQAPAPIDYAAWVARAEETLRECFTDVPLERLFSERFWRLTTGPVLRPNEMLRNEQVAQAEWLGQVKTKTDAMAVRFGQSEATVGVLDTHVLMHAKPLHEIDWARRLAASSAVLVVPLRVVDELDEKKYSRRDDLRSRARKRLRLLGRYVDEMTEIKPGVRLEIVGWRELDPSGVARAPLPPDVDILDTCEALRVYALPNAVSMVTGDTGMRIRARERDLPVTLLDEADMNTEAEGGDAAS